MNPRRQLNEMLAALGMPSLAFDGNGCARMLFDDEVVVNFETDEIAGHLHLYCDLGPLPAGGREPIYRALLEANLFGVQTRGATLAVDGTQDQVVLSRTVQTAVLGLSMLSELLEGFVACAAHWRRLIATRADDTTPRGLAVASQPGAGRDPATVIQATAPETPSGAARARLARR